jgi:hypothetical protein
MIAGGLIASWEPGGWVPGLGLVLFCAFIIGYNATVRLIVTMEELRLTRFGRLVWRAPLHGTSLIDGRGGDIAVLPAYVISHDGERIGYILKSWFDDEAIASIRGALQT